MTENRILPEDLVGKGVIALDDVPALSAQALKAKFEELVTDVVVPKHNAVVDGLADYATKAYVAGQVFLTGAADMTKAVYDAQGNGIVDDSERLGGELPAAFGKAPVRVTAEISATWTGTAAPYTQDVTVAGILATDAPHITPVYSDTLATALLQKEAWAAVSEADAGAGKITFTCFEDKPATAVPILVEVMR
ncbi:MAG: hypothetical protein VB021_09940 [Oscillospiraceae bacterium]|nr:hypothetical protein [Oscillospiraceae bacterium]